MNYLSRLLVTFWSLAAVPLQAQEQLEQEPISIMGNQGLPRTMYIAPWKEVGSPLETERLEGEFKEDREPLEPDLFQLELDLYKKGYSTD